MTVQINDSGMTWGLMLLLLAGCAVIGVVTLALEMWAYIHFIERRR